MTLLREKLHDSAVFPRIFPYAVIVVLTTIQNEGVSGAGHYWLYFLKILVGAWCIWQVWSFAPEMRWAFSWEAVVVGVLVCVVWVGLDPFYPKIGGAGEPWNPFEQFPGDAGLAWFFLVMRTVGVAVVVPPIEELFYRSFLYRYSVRLNFTAMPLNRVHWLSLIFTSAIFGVVHHQWVAGFLCGLAYQWLVLRKNRLGDAMTAHGITNFLLALWVIWRHAWHFW